MIDDLFAPGGLADDEERSLSHPGTWRDQVVAIFGDERRARRAAVARTATIRALLTRARVFVVDNLARHIFLESDQEEWVVGRDFASIVPPYYHTWVEFRNPGAVRSGGELASLAGFDGGGVLSVTVDIPRCLEVLERLATGGPAPSAQEREALQALRWAGGELAGVIRLTADHARPDMGEWMAELVLLEALLDAVAGEYAPDVAAGARSGLLTSAEQRAAREKLQEGDLGAILGGLRAGRDPDAPRWVAWSTPLLHHRQARPWRAVSGIVRTFQALSADGLAAFDPFYSVSPQAMVDLGLAITAANVREFLARWDTISFPAFLCYSLLTARNATLEEHAPRPKAARARAQRTGEPLRAFRTVRVVPLALRRASGASTESDERDAQPFHEVRGHFKTYTQERPLFGRVVGRYWWSPQARGSLVVGVVEKDYDVCPPADGPQLRALLGGARGKGGDGVAAG